MCGDEKRIRIHMGYWILMLLLGLIFIITQKFTDTKDFTSYIGNASVLISLVLGLVAIFYSFVSNNGLAGVVGTISQTASSLQASRENMDSLLQSTANATKTLNASAQNITQANELTRDSLEKLGIHLEHLKSESAATRAELTAIRDRMEAGTPKSAQDSTRPAPSDSFVMNFLKWSSVNANLLAYACVLAGDSGKRLLLKKFSEATRSNMANYFSGFLSGMHACDLITREYEGLPAQEYEIIYCADALKRLAKTYILEYAESIKNENGPLYARITESIPRLEAEFGA